MENPALVKLEYELSVIMISIQDINTQIQLVITSINNNSDPTSVTLSYPLIVFDFEVNLESTTGIIQAFFKTMVDSGNDVLLLADQADQFLCVANDAFERIVDTFLLLSRETFADIYVQNLLLVKTKYQQMLDYLLFRENDLTTSGILTTQGNTTILYNNIIVEADILASTITDIDNLVNKSTEILTIFKESLQVNSSVGITLSVSKRAWNTMKKLSSLNYTITEVMVPEIVSTDTIDVITQSSIGPDNLGGLEIKFLLDLPKLLIKDNVFESDDFKFEISHIHEEMDNHILSSNFNSKSSSVVNQILYPKPFYLKNIFGHIKFMTNLDLSENSLNMFYNLNSNTNSVSLIEFKNQFQSDTFTSIRNKFIDDINSSVIDEYQLYFDKNEQLNHLTYILKNVRIRENINLENMRFEDELLFDGLDLRFEELLNSYIRQSFITFKSTSNYLSDLTIMLNSYHNNHLNDFVISERLQGNCTIKQYKNDVLYKNISNISYNIVIYRKNNTIVYMEGLVNDISFKIDLDILTLVFKIKSETFDNLHRVINQDRILNNTYKIDGYLYSTDSKLTSNIITYNEESQKVTTVVALGEVTNSSIVYNAYYDDISQYILERRITDKIVTTTYISSKRHIRIASAIANSYRTEYLANRMTFSEARVSAIVSSIRHLNYKTTLEEYIQFTNDLNIPVY